MSTTNVTNGTTTKQINTTNMNIATYNVQLDYQANNTYNNNTQNTTLQIKDGSTHTIGYETNTPWTRELVYKGELAEDKVWINYAHTPTIIQIPLENNFTITLKLSMHLLQSYGNFGLTTNPTELDCELRVYQNNINTTITIPDVFTQVNKIETITITRNGNTYTYTQNGNTYTTTVNNPRTVYFYAQKNGNGSIRLDTMTYQNL